MGVVVDGLPGLRAQLVDQSSHLGTSRLENWREHDKMSVHDSFLSVKALLGASCAFYKEKAPSLNIVNNDDVIGVEAL